MTCLCVCVCIYIYIYIHIHTYIHITLCNNAYWYASSDAAPHPRRMKTSATPLQNCINLYTIAILYISEPIMFNTMCCYITKAIHISLLTEKTKHIPHVFFHYILNRQYACAPCSIPGHSMSDLVTISNRVINIIFSVSFEVFRVVRIHNVVLQVIAMSR